MPTTIKLLLNIEFKMSGYCVFYFLCQVLFSVVELPKKKKKNKGFGGFVVILHIRLSVSLYGIAVKYSLHSIHINGKSQNSFDLKIEEGVFCLIN